MKLHSGIYRLLSCLIILTSLYSCNEDEKDDVTLEKKIGQMLLVGFRGTELDESNHIVRDIEQYNLGGVILYEKDGPTQSRPRNISSPQQVKQLVADLKSHSTSKLFVAIDQEGGVVDRLKAIYGFPESRSAGYLGRINNLDSTSFYAAQTALTLRDMGININFAPVVDLNINPSNPVIGALDRSFSHSWEKVVSHSRVFVDEHSNLGILTSCKHFPGHGSSKTDSHLGFTDVSDTWEGIEIQPYKELIGLGKCPMIMTAHIFNSQLDDKYPATLSFKTLNNLLRTSLAFRGLIISDAMDMKAITDNYGLEEALKLSINAGCDILIFSNNTNIYNEDIVPEAVTIISNLVKSGKISKDRINESYQRILKAKDSL